MIKKLLALTFILIIGMSTIPVTNAQRAIDPNLKPINAPGVPATGPGTEKECTNNGGIWDKNAQLCSLNEEEPINAFLQILGGAILMVSGGLAVIVIAVGGVMYITSRGNQQQLEFAKNTLVYGVIGMLVIIFSYFIIKWVLQIIISL